MHINSSLIIFIISQKDNFDSCRIIKKSTYCGANGRWKLLGSIYLDESLWDALIEYFIIKPLEVSNIVAFFQLYCCVMY